MRIRHPRLVATLVLAAGTLTGIAVVTAAAASPDSSGIPIGQPVTGTATYYDDAGYGACGTSIDAAQDLLVAVPSAYWTTVNPNVDPLCSGISVEVTYQGRTITVPVRDKCPSCDAGHIDLSLPAFRQLGDPAVGVLSGLTWTFVRSDGADPVQGRSPGTDLPTGGRTPARPGIGVLLVNSTTRSYADRACPALVAIMGRPGPGNGVPVSRGGTAVGRGARSVGACVR